MNYLYELVKKRLNPRLTSPLALNTHSPFIHSLNFFGLPRYD